MQPGAPDSVTVRRTLLANSTTANGSSGTFRAVLAVAMLLLFLALVVLVLIVMVLVAVLLLLVLGSMLMVLFL